MTQQDLVPEAVDVTDPSDGEQRPGEDQEAFELDDGLPFFAPVSFDLIDSLVSEYWTHRKSIDAVVDFHGGSVAMSVIHYFFEGNRTEERGRMALERSDAQLFNPEGAIGALRGSYWAKALNLTDVLNYMPQARRSEWNEQIKHPLGKKKERRKVREEHERFPERFNEEGTYLNPDDGYEQQPLPEFTAETVRGTLDALTAMRAEFFGERIDGIFHGLSGTHVTNSPEGFRKRLIIAHVNSHEKEGLVSDLRCVVAKILGREEPKFAATTAMFKQLRGRWGELYPVDGGAIRMRIYKIGTAHLEVHPDIAWKLNQILASRHPAAIPAKFRQKPKRRPKDVALIQRPLPYAVIKELEEIKEASRRREGTEIYDYIPKTLAYFGSIGVDDHVAEEVHQVLRALGGVPTFRDIWWEFEYSARPIIQEVIITGCLPDRKSHQFYPTGLRLAKRAIEAAEIGPEDQCLEPSAGTGGLADLMPKDRTLCVEVSNLHAQILEAKGYEVTCMDFLTYAAKNSARQFDRVIMNPPFDHGRWHSHLEHAAALVKHGGRLVAILPSGARGVELQGFNTTWAGPFCNEFPGANVDVVLLTADKL